MKMSIFSYFLSYISMLTDRYAWRVLAIFIANFLILLLHWTHLCMLHPQKYRIMESQDLELQNHRNMDWFELEGII